MAQVDGRWHWEHEGSEQVVSATGRVVCSSRITQAHKILTVTEMSTKLMRPWAQYHTQLLNLIHGLHLSRGDIVPFVEDHVRVVLLLDRLQFGHLVIRSEARSQNPLAERGLNYYFKGALLSRDKPSADLNMDKFNSIMELTKDKGNKTACVLEYIPQTHINNVPAGATPFRRDLPGNMVINCQWKGDEPETAVSARQVARSVSELFVNEAGYGNYSESSRVVAHMVLC